MKYTVRPVTRPTATKPATTSVGSNKFQPVKVPGGLVSICLDMYILLCTHSMFADWELNSV